ncbi:RimJ/RimL family protein N-acetyltransferase [Microbacterium keratanolyticum]|uniref:Succinyl-CoA transferase n=1 Tax=Microbacterium keratanolyticum TaxID=67574 RepID=A0A9W6HU33_9MICO|nr:GNAT family protein [Microbacterium keratanolyticum]MBM7470301.1 RimJ/RimL family protein N-acetyltransferase [Microbacterium keratanolyticum]GLK02380.1 putative succinyl-CoA transferase [Microbacterium keratanolyticum]
MKLEDVWPLFGLEIATPRLTLRPVRDEDLPELAQAALAGVHAPERTPFSVPWTDAAPEDLPRNLAAFQWSLRSRMSPQHWTVAFAVHFEGRVVGSQDLSAYDFANRRTVNTGSWLAASAQGRGLGTEMRAALLLFAFDILGAEWAESGAASWNGASLRVSEKLGYELNGVTRVSPRHGEPVDEQKVRLNRARFVRPDWRIGTRGVEPALAQLGITSDD